MVFAVQKWEQYLCGNKFVIVTDKKSLTWLLEQKISTPFQQFWLSKLMGFQYDILYRSGKKNLAADALSRLPGAQLMALALSAVQSDILEKIQASYVLDNNLQQTISQIQQGQSVPKYSYLDGLLRKKGKLVIGPDEQLRQKILKWVHDSPFGGHSGRQAALKKLRRLFCWKGMTKSVQHFIRQCLVCQSCKSDSVASPGLLQPLPIPGAVWVDISLDFVEGIPKSYGKDVILVVVDRFSKAAHFSALAHPYSAVDVAQVYLDTVFKLHGWPQSIVSDRDSIFISDFWQALFTIQGTNLLLSSSYHPQTDGQTEIINKCIETYLRCLCSETPKEWSKWLPSAEWWYNTTFHTATELTPYEIVYN